MAWKRAGRAQDPTGVDGTAPGGLMVQCPACPHPGQNLPDDWKAAGPLLYAIYIFQLKMSLIVFQIPLYSVSGY